MTEINSSMINGIDVTSGILKSNMISQSTLSGNDFASTLSNALEQYNEYNAESDTANLELLSGNTDDLSDVLIAAKKSEIALNLTVQIRNKAVDAYKEIMNMQV